MSGALDVALALVAESLSRAGLFAIDDASTAAPTWAEAPPNTLGASHAQVVDEPTQ
jgi:hypothetical protein